MIGRPPRSRNERQQNPQLSEEQLKQELYMQAENKKKEIRIQQLQEKEENLKQLESAGQDVESYRNKVYAEYKDVLPQQSKAEQERAARIKLREEERLRRMNGLGSAYEQEKQRLPQQLEQKLIENLNQINPNSDWLDRQQNVNQNKMPYQPVVQNYPAQIQNYPSAVQNYPSAVQNYQEQFYGAKQIQQSHVNQIKNDSYKQPMYEPKQQMQNNSNFKGQSNEAAAFAEQEREKKRKYKEQLDMQINQRGQQPQHHKPQSQQNIRPQQPQQEVDFFSKFGQPQSQQGWRQQQQQQQQNADNAAIQRQKYREELDRQIQEKKNREQQTNSDQMKRPISNPTNVFDFPQETDMQNYQPPQSPPYYGSPPLSADDQTKGRFVQRRFTSGAAEDPQRQAQKEQYAEELKRQVEEKKRKKKQEDEENRKRDELEHQQFQQQMLLEKQRQDEQRKQKLQADVFEPKEVPKRGKMMNEQNDVIKKSALQILQPESDIQQSPNYQQPPPQQNYQQQPPFQQQYAQQPPYQPPQSPYPQQHPAPYYHQQPYSTPYGMPMYGAFPQQDLQQFQQVLFNDQPTHQPQAIMVHQQYLMQLQQNRQEIDLVRQILEEKLRLQQIEMQNQLMIDQYQRKVMDIQREQKLFEQEIAKLQDFIQGKQKKPLDPSVFASSVFFNALGKKDHYNQISNIQQLKISPFQSPTAGAQSSNFQRRDFNYAPPYSYDQQREVVSRDHLRDIQSREVQSREVPTREMQQRELPQKEQIVPLREVQQLVVPKQQVKQGITESMIDNDVELPGESEYVNFSEEQLGKSFLPELREIKQKTQQSQIQQQDLKIQSQQFKTLQSQNVSNLQQSITEQSCELPCNTAQKSMPPPELSVVQSNVEDEPIEDQNSQEYEQKDFEPEEEEIEETQVDNPFQVQEQVDELVENEDVKQNSDREAYDYELPNPQNYDLNMLKTQEYYAMFVENIKPQSRQQELKFPTKLLHQNTQKLSDSIQQSSMYEQSEIVDSQIKRDDGGEVQMSQAQFSVYQQSMAIPEEEEPAQVSQKVLRNSSRKYSKPKTVDVFKNDQLKNSTQEVKRTQNQSKCPPEQVINQQQVPDQSRCTNQQMPDQSRCTNQQMPDQSRCTNQQMPDQSRCTNHNPIASQTFLYQPRVELVKSRLENLFQHTNELIADLPKVKTEKIVAVDDDDIKSYKIEENSQWQQQLDLFAYEQSHS